jgi:hypothetical protein
MDTSASSAQIEQAGNVKKLCDERHKLERELKETHTEASTRPKGRPMKIYGRDMCCNLTREKDE